MRWPTVAPADEYCLPRAEIEYYQDWVMSDGKQVAV